MNMILVLFGMCLFCGLVAVYVGLKNQREERRTRSSRVGSSNLNEPRQKNAKETVRHLEWGHAHGKLVLLILLSGCFAFACRSSLAQEVVHAVAGNVASVNPAAKTLTLKLDDGSNRVFKDMSSSGSAIELDKTIQAQTTSAVSFKKVGARVVILFYGYGNQRTAVAIKDLGTNAARRVTGSVAEFDHHQHMLTLKGDDSQVKNFTLSEQTIVETPDGVIDGYKFHPSKGQRVAVVSGAAKGEQTALFINAS